MEWKSRIIVVVSAAVFGIVMNAYLLLPLQKWGERPAKIALGKWNRLIFLSKESLKALSSLHMPNLQAKQYKPSSASSQLFFRCAFYMILPYISSLCTLMWTEQSAITVNYAYMIDNKWDGSSL